MDKNLPKMIFFMSRRRHCKYTGNVIYRQYDLVGWSEMIRLGISLDLTEYLASSLGPSIRPNASSGIMLVNIIEFRLFVYINPFYVSFKRLNSFNTTTNGFIVLCPFRRPIDEGFITFVPEPALREEVTNQSATKKWKNSSETQKKSEIGFFFLQILVHSCILLVSRWAVKTTKKIPGSRA